MHRHMKVLAALIVGLLASLPGNVQPLRAGEPNPVTAIDILLEPDATMIEHAKAANLPLKADLLERALMIEPQALRSSTL